VQALVSVKDCLTRPHYSILVTVHRYSDSYWYSLPPTRSTHWLVATRSTTYTCTWS